VRVVEKSPFVGKIQSAEHAPMALRKNRKSANREVDEYWTLCGTVRTELVPSAACRSDAGQALGASSCCGLGGYRRFAEGPQACTSEASA
jgi:hypothetical protein